MAQEKSKKLNSKQLLAAQLIGQGKRHNDVASQLGLRAETLSRWLAQEPFRKAVNEANRALIEAIAHDTINLINQCHGAIFEALDANEDPSRKASIAIRYLGTFVKPYTVYDKLAETQKADENKQDFLKAMYHIMNTVEQLSFLRSSNSVYTDKEYRETAERIVNGWEDVEPRFYT